MSVGRRNNPEPGFSPGFFFAGVVALLVSACGEPVPASQDGDSRPARMTVPATIEDDDIDEASGIAVSRRDPALFWIHEDSGAKARLYAIDRGGRRVGRIKLEDSDNDDWEDLAAFEIDGRPYLLAADTGNNDADRETLSLYVIAEPDLDDDDKPELDPVARIDFRYPDGRRDTESVAVDVDAGRILLLTKRDIPPRLYSVPLVLEKSEPVVATFLAEVTSLPMPARKDLLLAPKIDNYYWQPTAMDIAADGSALAILTYGAVYYFEREADEDWTAALARRPLGFDIRRVRDAEALAFGHDGKTLYITTEKRNAPIVMIEILDEETE